MHTAHNHAGNRPGFAPRGRGPWRIAFVTETWPPEVNGVATTACRLVRELRSRGHSVQVVRPGQAGEDLRAGATPDEVLVRGVPIPNYPQLRIGLPAGGRLRRLWRASRPDVVHLATEGPVAWSALRAARALGCPVTSDFRTNFHAYSEHYGLTVLRAPTLAWLRGLHNRTDATTVPTATLRHLLQDERFERLSIVARGIDCAEFAPDARNDALRAAWGVAAGTPVMAFVGRLAAEKNLDLFVRTFEAVRAVRADARALLVGDGPLAASLRRRMGNAIFAGTRRGEDLARHYASADLFVFPSLTETWGNVTGEAMASGLPVVAFDHASASELVRPGVDGLLAAPGAEHEFISAAVRLCAENDWRALCARSARLRAESFGWPRVVAQFESVLTGAMGAVRPLRVSAGASIAR